MWTSRISTLCINMRCWRNLLVNQLTICHFNFNPEIQSMRFKVHYFLRIKRDHKDIQIQHLKRDFEYACIVITLQEISSTYNAQISCEFGRHKAFGHHVKPKSSKYRSLILRVILIQAPSLILNLDFKLPCKRSNCFTLLLVCILQAKSASFLYLVAKKYWNWDCKILQGWQSNFKSLSMSSLVIEQCPKSKSCGYQMVYNSKLAIWPIMEMSKV